MSGAVAAATAKTGLQRRLAWLVGARLAVLTVLLGGLGAVSLLRESPVARPPEEPFTVFAAALTLGAAFAAAGVYAAWLRTERFLLELADVQLVLDALTWTVIVYLTGGPSSGAASLYGLSILAGSGVTGLRGTAIAAFTSLLGYVVLVVALRAGVILPPPDQPTEPYQLHPTELGVQLTLNVTALLVVAGLGGYLAERLRVTGGRLELAEERAVRAERLALLGEVAAGLAHEIRNPLGSISGSIQLLRTAPALSAEDKQLCDIVHRESQRLNDLVSDMLDLSRPRAPVPVPIDIAGLTAELVKLASRSGRGVSDVALEYVGPTSCWVRADPSQLRQLLWNLVRNAVQASNAGDTVRVSLAEVGGQVQLEVRDSGVGLDETAKARLFDAFYTTRTHGLGLGLAVVKRIVDEHGFELTVDSAPNEGACFRVRLGAPLAEHP